jgi:hypothetical protein
MFNDHGIKVETTVEDPPKPQAPEPPPDDEDEDQEEPPARLFSLGGKK